MAEQKVNYNEISSSYDNRYHDDQWGNMKNILQKLIFTNSYKTILEVGCGTGYWLDSIKSAGVKTFGLDYSIGMLKKVTQADRCKNIVNGDANFLPFRENYFDLIFCVNALHHFQEKKQFIIDAAKYLSPGGMIVIIGVDPRCENDDWYIYDFFESTYEDDLIRFPAWDEIEDWMNQAGLNNVAAKIIDEIRSDKIGEEVLSDAWLQKGGTSQLSKLNDEEYGKGYKKVLEALDENKEKIFKVRITFKMIYGMKK